MEVTCVGFGLFLFLLFLALLSFSCKPKVYNNVASDTLVKERRLDRVRFPILKCTKHGLVVLLLQETPYSTLFVGNKLRAGDIHPHPGPHPGPTEPLNLAGIDIPKELKSQVKVAHLNVRSLKSREHFCLVKDTLIRNNFDIFTISESNGQMNQ